MRGTPRWRPAVAALAVGLLAGCGTTVDLSSVDAARIPGGTDSLSAPGAVGGEGTVGTGVPGGPTANRGAVAGSATNGSAPGGPVASVPPTATGGATGAGGIPPAAAPGVTAKKIYIGVQFSSDAAAGNRAIGAAGAAASYDFRDVMNAVIRYANKNGGFAGRQLEPNYFDYSVARDQTVQDQAACSKWTEDSKVFAITPVKADTLKACAEKAGAISLTSGTSIQSTYQRFPHFFEPFGIRLDREGPATVTGLHRSGYFSGTLGMVTWEHPSYQYAMSAGWLPALKRYGISPKQVAYVKVPDQIDGIASMSAAMASIVTQFKAAGIDHVIIADGAAGVFSGAGLTFEFMNQAESQNYRPRYGQNAANAPGWDVLPAQQMDRALAVMDSDHAPEYDEGWKPNKQREKCFKIQADAGLPVSTSNYNDMGLAAQACDTVFFLQQVLNSVPVVSADAFAQGVARLGSSFKSAFVYGTKFGPGRRDGSELARTAEYLQACRCLKYKGAPYPTS